LPRPGRNLEKEEDCSTMPDSDGTARAEAREQRVLRIGRAIEEHRGELSQMELAQKAGVALNTVALLERGKTMPWPTNRRKIETALGWPTGTLTAMFSDGAPAPPLPSETEKTTTTQPEPQTPPPSTADRDAAILNIALHTTYVLDTCSELVLRYGGSGPDTGAAIAELDRQTQALEAIIAASYPSFLTDDSDQLFKQIVTVLTELRSVRKRTQTARNKHG
jgi:DNA-binding XRE family transcriptional regulator